MIMLGGSNNDIDASSSINSDWLVPRWLNLSPIITLPTWAGELVIFIYLPIAVQNVTQGQFNMEAHLHIYKLGQKSS